MLAPETIDLSTLPSLPLESHLELPSISGIYFAIDSSGKIQYIGRSVNLRQRWLFHHRKAQLGQIGGISLVWLEVSEISLLPEIESALIEWFKPLLNNAVIKSSGSFTGLINTIESFAKSRGCESAYKFWKLTGIPQATAYRLFRDRTAYPSKETQEAICEAFKVQPGEFLAYVLDENTSADSEDMLLPHGRE